MADLASQVDALAARAGQEVKAVRTDTLGGLMFVKLTQAQYDALPSKGQSTVYLIVG